MKSKRNKIFLKGQQQFLENDNSKIKNVNFKGQQKTLNKLEKQHIFRKKKTNKWIFKDKRSIQKKLKNND